MEQDSQNAALTKSPDTEAQGSRAARCLSLPSGSLHQNLTVQAAPKSKLPWESHVRASFLC